MLPVDVVKSAVNIQEPVLKTLLFELNYILLHSSGLYQALYCTAYYRYGHDSSSLSSSQDSYSSQNEDKLDSSAKESSGNFIHRVEISMFPISKGISNYHLAWGSVDLRSSNCYWLSKMFYRAVPIV